MSKEDEIGCICNEYDGRGWSVCGHRCPEHPPQGLCPVCKDKVTYNSVTCFRCWVKDLEARRPPEIREWDKLLHHVTECLYIFRGRLETVEPVQSVLKKEASEFEKLREWVIDRTSEASERLGWSEYQ